MKARNEIDVIRESLQLYGFGQTRDAIFVIPYHDRHSPGMLIYDDDIYIQEYHDGWDVCAWTEIGAWSLTDPLPSLEEALVQARDIIANSPIEYA